MSENANYYSRRITATYLLIGKILGRLPIPVAIVPIGPETRTGEAVDSLLRARDLTAEMPMPQLLRAAINTLILEWLNASLVCMLAEAEAEEGHWMEQIAALALMRVESGIEVANQMLDGSFPFDLE